MSSVDDSVPVVLHYFVDESGDPTLFARRRRSIVGQKGVLELLHARQTGG